MIADESGALVVESMADGLHIHENPVGVMTNSPPFDYHLLNLANHMALNRCTPHNTLAPAIDLPVFSRGLGAVGLPGDWSSPSRFLRCAFTKLNSVSGEEERESVQQFFHILGSVEHPRGVVDTGHKEYEITIYSCCCNTTKGIYYYTTYENSRITAIDMHRENLDGTAPIAYPLLIKSDILYQN
jgi:choloylglycine hydrolase